MAPLELSRTLPGRKGRQGTYKRWQLCLCLVHGAHFSHPSSAYRRGCLARSTILPLALLPSSRAEEEHKPEHATPASLDVSRAPSTAFDLPH